MNNVNKKLVVRLSEGIGNQLFMYANAYSLSKKFDYNLFIDNLKVNVALWKFNIFNGEEEPVNFKDKDKEKFLKWSDVINH